MDVELAWLSDFQSHRPTRQCCGDEKGLISKMDASGALHAPGFHPWIGQVLGCALEFASRGLIQFGGPFHPQGLVRALLVKHSPPFIETGLLFLTSQFAFNIQVQAFVSAVVLGTSWSASFQINS